MKPIMLAGLSLALFATKSSGASVQWTTASGGNGHFYEAVLAGVVGAERTAPCRVKNTFVSLFV
jgi:hypothetical protein